MPEQIWILTGEIQSGKTSSLLNWSRERNDVHGILTPVLEGTRYFCDIHSQEQFRMEADYEEEALVVGRYRFSKNAFNKAARIIEESIQSKGWLVIDEIGPMEIRGEGFASILKRILHEYPGKILLVIRKQIVQDVIHHFDLSRSVIYVVETTEEIG